MILHRGRTNEPVKISKIIALVDKNTGHSLKRKQRHLLSGQAAIVEIQLENKPLPLETFANNKEIGRIVLRKDGATIAAGVVDELIIENPVVNTSVNSSQLSS